MNKILQKISKNLSRMKEIYPELSEIIKKSEEKELILPRLEVNKILTIKSSLLIWFLKEFYEVDLKLINKKDIKKPKPVSKEKQVFQNLPGEEWKEIMKGYKVSNLGRIINWKGRLITPRVNISGQLFVSIDNRSYLVHTLIAKNFLKKPKGKKIIQHIDGDITNNSASNLKWVNLTRRTKPGQSSGEVYKYSETGEFIEKYDNTVEAAKNSGVNQSNLSKILNASRGQLVKYKNYLWERK